MKGFKRWRIKNGEGWNVKGLKRWKIKKRWNSQPLQKILRNRLVLRNCSAKFRSAKIATKFRNVKCFWAYKISQGLQNFATLENLTIIFLLSYWTSLLQKINITL